MEIKKERKYYFRSFENCGFVQAHQTTKQISGEKNSLNLMSSILMKTNSHMYTPCKYHAEAYRIHSLDPSAAFFAFRFFFHLFFGMAEVTEDSWNPSIALQFGTFLVGHKHSRHPCSTLERWTTRPANLNRAQANSPAPSWSSGSPDLQTSMTQIDA